jgi:Fe-Mn family superoxide dismutase
VAFTLPDLPFSFDALEPHIDAKTMEIHHGKHHAAYVSKANAALEGTALADVSCACDVCGRLGELPESVRTAARNNAGGHFNHSLFWKTMTPGGSALGGALLEAIDSGFGSLQAMQDRFGAAAAGRFGSGWAWLCALEGGKLAICSTANQDNPVMHNSLGDVTGCAGRPILGIDVWEHAYYLNYQNRRPDYVSAWWNVVHWAKVGELYEKSQEKCCAS